MLETTGCRYVAEEALGAMRTGTEQLCAWLSSMGATICMQSAQIVNPHSKAADSCKGNKNISGCNIWSGAAWKLVEQQRELVKKQNG
jgi:hypothetical protein